MACRGISIKRLLHGRQRRYCYLISPTRHGCMAHSEMWYRQLIGIYKFNMLRNWCYLYTTFQWWCGFSISIGNSTGYATEPWILVINKTATSDRPPLTVGLPVTLERYWASFQVTRLFHKATVSHCDLFLLLHMYLLFETSPGWLQGWRVFCFFYLDLVGEHSAPMYLPVYYLRRILISRQPRVFRRFKRRSCCKTVCTTLLFTMMLSSNGNIICITGHLCTKASNAELWCFLSSVPE